MNHEEILKQYVSTHNAIVDLFQEESDSVDSATFKRLREASIRATRDYRLSLNEQGFAVPAGLEETNLRDMKLYGIE